MISGKPETEGIKCSHQSNLKQGIVSQRVSSDLMTRIQSNWMSSRTTMVYFTGKIKQRGKNHKSESPCKRTGNSKNRELLYRLNGSSVKTAKYVSIKVAFIIKKEQEQ